MNNQYVVFELEKQNYAIDINHVREITEITEITKVPNSNEYVKGILKLRDSIISIIDLKKRMSIENKNKEKNKILVVDIENIQMGLLIDIAKDVKTFSVDQIDDSSILSFKNENYINGIIRSENDIIMILNVKKIIGENETVTQSA
ncbi:chemotaxis protein CheW [Clostridiaceae bacterium HSG29]|nr:chemotaxis protein CheW [Clostridiaceae bacterium HSG29]